MTTSKITFVIDGQEPQARNIFAVVALGAKKLEEFNKQYRVFVGKNSEGIFFTKNLSEAFQFEDEDTADNVKTGFENSKNMSDCDWNTILLVDGVPATDEQLEQYANGTL